ncbi:MAG: hypothetical protein GY943_14475 [Chloroflexi bacterium]|nr:hypothetical protein [Chloroflexota bacterium]
MKSSPWALVADWLFEDPGRRLVIGRWAWLGINSKGTVGLDDPESQFAVRRLRPSHRALAKPQKRRSKTDTHAVVGPLTPLCVGLHLSPSEALHISHAHQPITGLRPGSVILNSQSATSAQGD